MATSESIEEMLRKIDPTLVKPSRPSQTRKKSGGGRSRRAVVAPAAEQAMSLSRAHMPQTASPSSPAIIKLPKDLGDLCDLGDLGDLGDVGDLAPGDNGETRDVMEILAGTEHHSVAQSAAATPKFVPREPKGAEETGLPLPFLFELVLRTIYNRGRMTGLEIAAQLRLSFPVLEPLLPLMRKQLLIDIVGQKGAAGDGGLEYEIKPPKGAMAVQDALHKTEYLGPAPVPFRTYVESIRAQTIKGLTVTRHNIRKAFSDLIITQAVFEEIGPAINSAQSIFLFGYPGNGKTSIAERITRLMGDDLGDVYVPHAVEVNGEIIKVYDPTVHDLAEKAAEARTPEVSYLRGDTWDQRFVKIKRPTIVTGGELTLPMLDLRYNPIGKFYEAPMQMKANGGIFMIDDFGRQQVRAMDLLNRWIVPLEKRYDYLTTVTGTKIEVPFDELLIFSTNLDPQQLADEAFLRRIKYKIEIRDPDESQWREIWRLVCRGRKVEYDDRGLDHLVKAWYRPYNRPFRMCHPRDILDQMINLAKFREQPPRFSPDLIDAACRTYFVSQEKKDFGAKVRLD